MKFHLTHEYTELIAKIFNVRYINRNYKVLEDKFNTTLVSARFDNKDFSITIFHENDYSNDKDVLKVEVSKYSSVVSSEYFEDITMGHSLKITANTLKIFQDKIYRESLLHYFVNVPTVYIKDDMIYNASSQIESMYSINPNILLMSEIHRPEEKNWIFDYELENFEEFNVYEELRF